MAEEMYEVLCKRFTGRHGIYTKGRIIPRSEIFKNCDLEVCLKGQKNVKRKNKSLPDKDPCLKLVKQ